MESEEKTQLFSSRLIGIRNGLGLTQTELADKVGVSLRSVQHWESGEFVPRGQQLRNLAEHIGVSVSYLLGEENQPAQFHEISYSAGPEQELRLKCHGHLDRVLDECQGNRDQLAWTYVELQRRLPIKPAQSGRGDNPAYRPLNSISEDEAAASVVAAERALELERRSRPSSGAGGTTGGKLGTSPGTSRESKDKRPPPGQAPK